MMRRHGKNRSHGFTLFEILIVFSIIVLIILFLLLNLSSQVQRAQDSRRKSDLSRLQKIFEEYYNDRQCYPYLEVLQECNGSQLSEYIKKVPCDPVTKTPYLYVNGGDNLCLGYKICTKLQNLKDTDIIRAGCDPVAGCENAEGNNYCVGVGAPEANPGAIITPEITVTIGPTPTPLPDGLSCTPGGACNAYQNPAQKGCTVVFAAGSACRVNGVDQCQFVQNRCIE
jgi:type II secretory pathway pseudopilin PulG